MRMNTTGSDAEQLVMEDLVNALLAEQFFLGHPHAELLSPEAWLATAPCRPVLQALRDCLGASLEQAYVFHWKSGGEAEGTIVFPLEPAIVQPYRFKAELGLYEARLDERHHVMLQKLGPKELMVRLRERYESQPGIIDPASLEQFLHMLEGTLLQTSWSLENEQPEQVLSAPSSTAFLQAEKKAAFRDRPFHPVSKVKLGWGKDECRSYTVEYGGQITLHWMAVHRERLICGQPQAADPMTLLLSEKERSPILEEMNEKGLDPESFVLLPVHPWQMENVLPRHLAKEIKEGICIPLRSQAGAFSATSSVRSLLPADAGSHHVKLPLGIRSLGGLRYLSAVKLMNGQRAEQLLRKAVERDDVLNKRLFLCDETNWWAYLPENRDLFADSPRHLSALVRQYPAAWMEDPNIRLIPMSALAVCGRGEAGHLFDEWLAIIGERRSESAIHQLLREVIQPFFDVCVRLFALGMMPEVHGQNAVLLWREGKITGLLLRDHDSLRVHVPWLLANGLEDPKYTLRPGVPESLYHQTPESLLSFFQMLGIHVNSYAIIECLSRHYGLGEDKLWQTLQECLEAAVSQATLAEEVQAVLQQELFGKTTWPWKQIIRPLLKHHAKVPSSMPYAKGEAPNPFHAKARVFT